MTGIETLVWLVLMFADGPSCLVQGSFHWLPEGLVFVREDGCAVHSHQEGAHVVLWSDRRWVAIRIPAGARSLSYRWGRAVAFVNGDSVTVHYGNVLGARPQDSSMKDRGEADALSKCSMGGGLIPRKEPLPIPVSSRT